MTQGWGAGAVGTSYWGSGSEDGLSVPPVITALDPRPGQTGLSQTKPLSITVTDNVEVRLSTLNLSVNGLNWIIGGVAVNGASFVATVNASNGFDLLVTPPDPYTQSSLQEVAVSVVDTDLNGTSIVYSFSVGVGLRLLSVRNPVPNLLLAHFNKALLLNDALLSVSNWEISPVSSGAAPITIDEVIATTTQPDVAHIRYSGGGSTYELEALASIVAQDGAQVERGFNTALFEILFGDGDQGTVRLFDSIFGPLGIQQRVITRRTMDDHTAGRSLALALDEQFRLRFQQLDDTVGRDGRPGKLRTTQ